MPDFPLAGVQRYQSRGEQTGSSAGTTITAGATNTKGSYSTLGSTLTVPWSGFFVMIGNPSGTNRDFLVDISVDPAGGTTYQLLVPDVLYGIGNVDSVAYHHIPIPLPSGAQVAARCQSSTASSTIAASVVGYVGALAHPAPLGRCVNYGSNTADSSGVTIPGNATANTEGAWTAVGSATVVPHRALSLCIGSLKDGTRVAATYLLDIGLDLGGGSFQEIIPDLRLNVQGTTGDDVTPHGIGPFPLSVPVGATLAARVRSSTNTSGDRDIDLAILGIG